MARRAKLWVTGLALALVALWSAEDAFAGDKMRVCVLKISGTRDDDLKNDVIRLINQPYSILKASTFFKTATRMRIGKKLTPPNLRRLAKFLRLGAMIDGSLVAKSGRYRLVLKVRDGRSGVVVERIRHTLRGKNLNESEKKRLRRDLISALERIRLDAGAVASGGFGGDDDEEEEEKKEEKKEKKEKVPVDDLEEDEGADDLEEDVAPRRKTKAELAAERRAALAEKRRKAREERIARREAREEARRKAREERIAKRKAADEERRKAREEARRKRQEEAERRRKEREARKAAKAKGDEEDDLEDDLEEDDLESDVEEDDLEEDLEEDEESDVEESKPTRTAGAGDDDEEEDEEEEGPVVTKSPGPKDAGPAGAPAVIANAGLGAFSRTLTFDFDGALMGAERPIDYESSFVPSAFVDLELYPMALTGERGLLADIGVDARFEQALSLSSTVDPDGGAADNAFDVATTYRRFAVGLRYRLELSPVLIGLRVGYGQSAFELDKGGAMGMVDIPNIKYTYVDPGVTVSYPMGKLSIDAAARFLAMLSAGEIQEPTSYGQTKILGLDVDAGVNYLVTSAIGVRLGVRLAQMNLTFRGTGDLSDRNNDMAQDVDAATDRYLGGYLTGSYRF